MSVIFYILGVISGISAFIYLYDKATLIFLERITWRRIIKGIKIIRENIWRDSYSPDIIVGAGRAGAIIAGMLSGNLREGKIPIYCMDFSYSWPKNIRKVTIHKIRLPLKDKNILIVVGEVHTGETLNKIIDTVQSFKPKEIKTAALFESGEEHLKPDYFAFKISGNKRMPWHLSKNYEKKSFPM